LYIQLAFAFPCLSLTKFVGLQGQYLLMKIAILRRPTFGANVVLIAAAIYLVAAVNGRFWSLVFDSAASGGISALAVLAVAIALLSLTLLMLLPLGLRWVMKPALVAVLILAAGAAYFISDYGAVIDRHALASVYESNAREASEWLSARMIWTIALYGLLPAALLCWIKVEWQPVWREAWSRFKLAALALFLLIGAALVSGKDIASLLRNNMALRFVVNPYSLLTAQLSYLDHARSDQMAWTSIALDAKRAAPLLAGRKPIVVILVIGESARASSLHLNGYGRDTDLELQPIPLVNFSHVSSCGTNTATSLPCMFSDLGRKYYDDSTAKHRDNLLDVLMRANYDVLWLDNNTGSKGLAKHATERNLADGTEPPLCGNEGCLDEVLLADLRQTLPTINKDTVIVVHMLGSHGPAYYARYPQEFAAFTPECRTNELQRCSDVEILNTYDNSILYTTHILANMIGLLDNQLSFSMPTSLSERRCLARRGQVAADAPACTTPSTPVNPSAASPSEQNVQSKPFDAALLFVSDHGESLGEHGLYLHGAPYAIAPNEQTHVPMMFWTSAGFNARRGLDLNCLRQASSKDYSHDNFFHSVLGLTAVSTEVYRSELDLFAPCDRSSAASAN